MTVRALRSPGPRLCRVLGSPGTALIRGGPICGPRSAGAICLRPRSPGGRSVSAPAHQGGPPRSKPSRGPPVSRPSRGDPPSRPLRRHLKCSGLRFSSREHERGRTDVCRAEHPALDRRRGRSIASFATGSPSSRTPPWASARRASEVEISKAGRAAPGRWTSPGACRRGRERLAPRAPRRAARAHVHAVEAVLRRRRSLGAVEARDKRAGERALGVPRTELGRRGLAPSSSEYQDASALVGDAERLAVHLVRRVGHADVVAERLRHLALAVGPGEDRHRQDGLLGDPVRALDVAREQQVELLIGAAELDVGLDRHRVVALQQRIEQLEDRDRRRGRRSAWRSRRARGSGRRSSCGRARNSSSIGMSSHSLLRRTSIRSRVEHLERLLLEGPRVGVDLARGESTGPGARSGRSDRRPAPCSRR